MSYTIQLESEIQGAIMTRYFYYQLVNYYVTVALTGINVHGMSCCTSTMLLYALCSYFISYIEPLIV